MGAAAARVRALGGKSRALASSPLPAHCCVVFSHLTSLRPRVLTGTMEIIQPALSESNGVKTERKHQASVRGGTVLSWPERGREIQGVSRTRVNPDSGSIADLLCGLGQVALPLCAS